MITNWLGEEIWIGEKGTKSTKKQIYGRAKYKYQDANGHHVRFFDSNDKYKIGDEIK